MSKFQDADTPPFLAGEAMFARHFGPSPPPVCVDFGALSHPGRVRTNNEDHFVVIERRRTRQVLLTNLPEGWLRPADDAGYVMAVADGLGGMAFGELASMLALRSGWEQNPGAIKWTWIVTDREIQDLRERVELVFQRMDEALQERARAHPECAGMGTTLTGAYTVGPEAFLAHVGDSRAYLWRAGALTQLTRDHTRAQEALDAGLPILSRSWYHQLTNCLGGSDRPPRVEFHHLRLADGDRLLLCTDGLNDAVADADIAALLARPGTAQETAQALVDAALAAGGRDNVTVIVARYAMLTEGEAPPPIPFEG
jgi:protein phosphatase